MSHLLTWLAFGAATLIFGGLWLQRRIKASLWKKCPKCKGANRGRRGLFGAYEHCPNPDCVGGEVPSAIGRAFGVHR